MNQRGFLTGVYLYVALGALAVFTALSLAVAYYRNSASRAEAEAALARDQRDRAIQTIKDQEKAIAAITAAKAALDLAIVERDRRARELEATKRRIANELDVLRKTLPQADQDCLVRDLPDSLVERLRL